MLPAKNPEEKEHATKKAETLGSETRGLNQKFFSGSWPGWGYTKNKQKEYGGIWKKKAGGGSESPK